MEFEVDIQPGSRILGTYKNQSYKIESALAEFIDNSTQSFFSHREELNKMGQTSCNINIEIYPEYIKIYDNAFGMELEDFKRALKLDSPPEDRSGRNEKGMGLKTSATCLGSFWTVETTQYGSKNKYYAEVDVDYIEEYSPKTTKAQVTECDENEHYTIIKITMLNKKISPSKVNSLLNLLSQMYCLDIRNNDLVMTINKEPVKYVRPDLWINEETGSAYMISFERSFTIDGIEYSFDGWVGIRETANPEFSGLTLFRKGRAIKMNYRPTALLGKPNSFPYQRIIGEIFLKGECWAPAYTKDELMWEGDIEDRFIQEVKLAAKPIIKKSTELRTFDKTISKESQKQIATNVNKSFKSADLDKVNEIVNTVVSQDINHELDTILPIVNEIKQEEFEKVELELQGINYIFNVKFENNDYNDWIKLNTIKAPNEYELTINYGLEYFGNFNKDKKNLEFMQKMAITLAVSILTSKNNGNRDAYKILSIINTIVRNVK